MSILDTLANIWDNIKQNVSNAMSQTYDTSNVDWGGGTGNAPTQERQTAPALQERYDTTQYDYGGYTSPTPAPTPTYNDYVDAYSGGGSSGGGSSYYEPSYSEPSYSEPSYSGPTAEEVAAQRAEEARQAQQQAIYNQLQQADAQRQAQSQAAMEKATAQIKNQIPVLNYFSKDNWLSGSRAMDEGTGKTWLDDVANTAYAGLLGTAANDIYALANTKTWAEANEGKRWGPLGLLGTPEMTNPYNHTDAELERMGVRKLTGEELKNSQMTNSILQAQQGARDRSAFTGSKLGELGESVGAQIPNMPLGIVGGEGLTLAAMGLSSLGSASEQALQNGADINQAMLYGLLSAGKEIGTEKLSPGIPGVNMDVGIGSLLGEGMEEAVGTYLDPFVDVALQDNSSFDKFLGNLGAAARSDLTLNRLGEAADAFAMGAASAGVMGGAGNVVNAVAHPVYTAEGIADTLTGSNRYANDVKDVNDKISMYEDIAKTSTGMAKETAERMAQDERDRKRTYQRIYATAENLRNGDGQTKKAAQAANAELIRDTAKEAGANLSDSQITNIAKIANKAGVAVEFTKDGIDFNGAKVDGLQTDDGRILINANASDPIATIFAHEITHATQGTSEYKSLRNTLASMANAGQVSTDGVDAIRNSDLTNEQKQNEITAVLAQNILGNDTAINHLANRDMNLLRYMYERITNYSDAKESAVIKAERAMQKAIKNAEVTNLKDSNAYKNGQYPLAEAVGAAFNFTDLESGEKRNAGVEQLTNMLLSTDGSEEAVSSILERLGSPVLDYPESGELDRLVQMVQDAKSRGVTSVSYTDGAYVENASTTTTTEAKEEKTKSKKKKQQKAEVKEETQTTEATSTEQTTEKISSENAQRRMLRFRARSLLSRAIGINDQKTVDARLAAIADAWQGESKDNISQALATMAGRNGNNPNAFRTEFKKVMDEYVSKGQQDRSKWNATSETSGTIDFTNMTDEQIDQTLNDAVSDTEKGLSAEELKEIEKQAKADMDVETEAEEETPQKQTRQKADISPKQMEQSRAEVPLLFEPELGIDPANYTGDNAVNVGEMVDLLDYMLAQSSGKGEGYESALNEIEAMERSGVKGLFSDKAKAKVPSLEAQGLEYYKDQIKELTGRKTLSGIKGISTYEGAKAYYDNLIAEQNAKTEVESEPVEVEQKQVETPTAETPKAQPKTDQQIYEETVAKQEETPTVTPEEPKAESATGLDYNYMDEYLKEVEEANKEAEPTPTEETKTEQQLFDQTVNGEQETKQAEPVETPKQEEKPVEVPQQTEKAVEPKVPKTSSNGKYTVGNIVQTTMGEGTITDIETFKNGERITVRFDTVDDDGNPDFYYDDFTPKQLEKNLAPDSEKANAVEVDKDVKLETPKQETPVQAAEETASEQKNKAINVDKKGNVNIDKEAAANLTKQATSNDPKERQAATDNLAGNIKAAMPDTPSSEAASKELAKSATEAMFKDKTFNQKFYEEHKEELDKQFAEQAKKAQQQAEAEEDYDFDEGINTEVKRGNDPENAKKLKSKIKADAKKGGTRGQHVVKHTNWVFDNVSDWYETMGHDLAEEYLLTKPTSGNTELDQLDNARAQHWMTENRNEKLKFMKENGITAEKGNYYKDGQKLDLRTGIGKQLNEYNLRNQKMMEKADAFRGRPAQAMRFDQMYMNDPTVPNTNKRAVLNAQIEVENERIKRLWPKKVAKGDIKLIDKISDAEWDAYEQAEGDAQKAELEKIYKRIGEAIPATMSERVRAWRYMMMLANPMTHIRNFFGNGAMQFITDYKDAVAVLVEAGVKRTKAGKDMLAQYTKESGGLARATGSEELTKFAHDQFNEMKEGGEDISKWGTKQGIEAYRRYLGIFDGISKFNAKKLDQSDDWFTSSRFSKEFKRLVNANGYTFADGQLTKNGQAISQEKLNELRNTALTEAKQTTFHDISHAAKLIQEFEDLHPAAGFFTGAIMPFKSTPINMGKRMIEYSPLGLAKSIVKGTSDFHKGNISANEFVNGIAKGLSGTSLFALGTLLSSMGLLRAGGDPDDDWAEKRYKEDVGLHQDYSFVMPIDGVTLKKLKEKGMSDEDIKMFISVEALNPAITPMLLGARWHEVMGSEGLWDEDADLTTNFRRLGINSLDIFGSMIQPLMDMSMMQGIQNLFEDVAYALNSSPEGETDYSNVAGAVMGSLGETFVSQFFPSIGGAINRTLDPVTRTTYDPMADTAFFRQLVKKIPFAHQFKSAITGNDDYWLQPLINARGEEVTSEGDTVGERFMNNFVNPFSYKTNKSTEADRKLLELYDKTGGDGLIPFNFKTAKLDGTKYTFTPEGRTQVNKDALGDYQKEIKAMIDSGAWDANDPEYLTNLLDKVKYHGTKNAEAEYFNDIGLPGDNLITDQDETVNFLDKKGVHAYQSYDVLSVQNDLNEDGDTIKNSAALRKLLDYDKLGVLEDIRKDIAAHKEDSQYAFNRYGLNKTVLKWTNEQINYEWSLLQSQTATGRRSSLAPEKKAEDELKPTGKTTDLGGGTGTGTGKKKNTGTSTKKSSGTARRSSGGSSRRSSGGSSRSSSAKTTTASAKTTTPDSVKAADKQAKEDANLYEKALKGALKGSTKTTTSQIKSSLKSAMKTDQDLYDELVANHKKMLKQLDLWGM